MSVGETRQDTIWHFTAEEVALPDQFQLRVSRGYSYNFGDYVYAVRVCHADEIAVRTGLGIEDARTAVMACRDEIMARTIAHLT